MQIFYRMGFGNKLYIVEEESRFFYISLQTSVNITKKLFLVPSKLVQNSGSNNMAKNVQLKYKDRKYNYNNTNSIVFRAIIE